VGQSEGELQHSTDTLIYFDEESCNYPRADSIILGSLREFAFGLFLIAVGIHICITDDILFDEHFQYELAHVRCESNVHVLLANISAFSIYISTDFFIANLELSRSNPFAKFNSSFRIPFAAPPDGLDNIWSLQGPGRPLRPGAFSELHEGRMRCDGITGAGHSVCLLFSSLPADRTHASLHRGFGL